MAFCSRFAWTFLYSSSTCSTGCNNRKASEGGRASQKRVVLLLKSPPDVFVSETDQENDRNAHDVTSTPQEL